MSTQMILFLVAGFLLIEGVVLFLIGRRNEQRARASQQWPSAEGQILEISSAEDEGVHTVKAKYKFEVGGKEYTGGSIRAGGARASSKSDLDQLLARYAPGQRVAVFYDPANPKRCVLERQAAAGQWIWAMSGAFSALAGIGLLAWAFTFPR
jgi:hypothetical protein